MVFDILGIFDVVSFLNLRKHFVSRHESSKRAHGLFWILKLNDNSFVLFYECEGSFQKNSPGVDSIAVIGRLEVDWYPNIYLDGAKCWKLGREQRRYYHPNMACLRKRHPCFYNGQQQIFESRQSLGSNRGTCG